MIRYPPQYVVNDKARSCNDVEIQKNLMLCPEHQRGNANENGDKHYVVIYSGCG